MGLGGLYRPHWGGSPRPLEYPSGEGITRCDGNTTPTDGTAGFAPGCIFRKKNGSAGDLLYVNNGSVTSCTFAAIPTGGTTGAADVGVADAGGFTAQTNVEAALAELYQDTLSVQGFVQLPLMGFRAIASNDIPALAGTPASGILAADTAPKLKRVNTSTDKALKIEWAATSVIEIAQGFYYPPDLDITKTYTVNIRAKMGGASDTPTIAVGVFEGIGGSNLGGNTGAASNSLSTLSATIQPTAAHPNFAAISLTPAAHGSDTLAIHEVYVLYGKKLLLS